MTELLRTTSIARSGLVALPLDGCDQGLNYSRWNRGPGVASPRAIRGADFD